MSQRRIKHRVRADVRVRPAAKSQPALDSGELSARPQPETTSAETHRLRWYFLLYLNWHVQPFWETLRDAWQSGDTKRWEAYWNVVDEWLLAAVRAVLDFWKAHPDSPQVTAPTDYLQFFGNAAFFELKPFVPVFSEPSPRISRPEQHFSRIMSTAATEHEKLNAEMVYESPEQFETRMRAEFDEQMKAYKRDYQNGFFSKQTYLERHPQLKDHILWLMYRFCRASLDEVINAWPGSARYEDPGGTITRKVNELAEKMGITLRPWTRK